MLVAIVALSLGDTFCDKVNNYSPVRACDSYQRLDDDDKCNAAWPGAAITFANRNFSTMELCYANCPSTELGDCFEVMSNFTNGLANDGLILTMGYVSIVDGGFEIAFMQEDASDCTVREYSAQDLLQACEQGWRTHHGIEPAEGRRRQLTLPRYNNRFETGVLDEAADTAEDVIMYVSIGLGACAFAGLLLFLYNRYGGKKFKTGENGLGALL
jgi:hypothetical protein